MLVEFEREHTRLLERNEELEMNNKQLRQLESRSRNNEQKVQDLQRWLSETEKLRRDLEGKVNVFLLLLLAHLSYAQDELLWSFFVRHPSIHASAPPSVNIFKRLLLWSPWANFAQISYGASLGRGNEKLLKWSQSIDQGGRHTHIW